MNSLNKIPMLLLFLVMSFNSYSNPKDGEFFGIRLNDRFNEKFDHYTYYNERFAKKYIRYYQNIFGKNKDQVTLVVTPVTNTIYEIHITTAFESYNEAQSMFNSYVDYFDSIYSNISIVDGLFNRSWWRVNEDYYIQMILRGTYRNMTLFGLSYDDYAFPEDIEFKENVTNGMIGFRFFYDNNSSKNSNISRLIDLESNKIKKQRALESGIVIP